MNPYHTAPLDEPLRVNKGRGRPQMLSWAVWNNTQVVAVFVRENAAESYTRRLNSWERETRRQG